LLNHVPPQTRHPMEAPRVGSRGGGPRPSYTTTGVIRCVAEYRGPN